MMWTLMAGMAALLGGPDDLAHSGTVYGQWYTHKRDSIIEIYDCGNQTPCGRVTWIDGDPHGQTLDTENDNKSLRDRPILGMIMLEGFEPHGEAWRNGSIYNPEDGNTYRAKMRLLKNGNLEVKGCVGPICRGHEWPRATGE